MPKTCYHCGEPCFPVDIVYDEKHFCCNGCKTVYELFESNDLNCYYELNAHFGTNPEKNKKHFDFLEESEIKNRLLEFNEEGIGVVSFYIPTMHCSSCIWVLEHIHKIHPGVRQLLVDFPKKTARITFSTNELSLRELAELLARIGYAPDINLASEANRADKIDRRLWYQLGVAGFAFGNIMLFSFPEYFDSDEYWLNQFKPVFRWLMFAFSIPVVSYAAKDYLISAYKGIRARILNIDVPISIGLLALFTQSTLDIVLGSGSGYFDSLTGLIFFLLLGKVFQQKTYNHLSFERDYRSYFPMAVTEITIKGEKVSKAVYKVQVNDVLFIRNQEIIPVDCILKSKTASIDYGFVTGESRQVNRSSGEQLYAGGKYFGKGIEVQVTKEVSQSYLTELWKSTAFTEDKKSSINSITDKISQKFTVFVLTIATIAALFWLWKDPSQSARIFTAVLIIACPCAIALAAPFTLGNALRWLGKKGVYARDTATIERLANTDTLVFDKTGTLTYANQNKVEFFGNPLSTNELKELGGILESSSHPLSRSILSSLSLSTITEPDSIREFPGEGILAIIGDTEWKIGSYKFVGLAPFNSIQASTVYIKVGETQRGYFAISSCYREDIFNQLNKLKSKFDLVVLSGDNDREQEFLQHHLGNQIPLYFNQHPADKLNKIKELRSSGKHVVMIGDGLNDAGALAAAEVGIAVSEDINVFTPASDLILEASQLKNIEGIIEGSKQSMRIIRQAFILSLAYNLIGLSFAISGKLEPVIAAILMPISSISIVIFTTLSTNRYFSRQNFKS